MSEAQQNEKPMPSAPEGITDPDQIAGAEERWQECPLNDCKRKPELLYADFYLRDIRNNRLMCSSCAVRVKMGYMAREVVRKSDDKFFKGSQVDNVIVLIAMGFASLVANVFSAGIGFFFFSYYIIPFTIGGAMGGAAAVVARNLTEKRVTRETQYFGVGGIAVGAFIVLLVGRTLVIDEVVLCTAGMVLAAWGILLRRI